MVSFTFLKGGFHLLVQKGFIYTWWSEFHLLGQMGFFYSSKRVSSVGSKNYIFWVSFTGSQKLLGPDSFICWMKRVLSICWKEFHVQFFFHSFKMVSSVCSEVFIYRVKMVLSPNLKGFHQHIGSKVIFLKSVSVSSITRLSKYNICKLPQSCCYKIWKPTDLTIGFGLPLNWIWTVQWITMALLDAYKFSDSWT